MRVKFTKEALLDHLNIDENALIEFIKLGLLTPEGWENLSFSKLLTNLYPGFTASWTLREVQHFESIRRLFEKNYHVFFRKIENNFNTFEVKLEELFERISEHDLDIKYLISQVQKVIDEQYEYIDANEFCETTGYSKRTFYNAISIVDPDVPTMKLQIPFYKSLLWVKRGRKWMTRRSEFEELRKNFSYDVLLVERHRREKSS